MYLLLDNIQKLISIKSCDSPHNYGLIFSASSENSLIIIAPFHIRNMRGVAFSFSAFSSLFEARVVEYLNRAKVVGCCNIFLVAASANCINIRPIRTLRPDSLHWPAQSESPVEPKFYLYIYIQLYQLLILLSLDNKIIKYITIIHLCIQQHLLGFANTCFFPYSGPRIGVRKPNKYYAQLSHPIQH